MSKFIEEIIEILVIINNELLKVKREFSGTSHFLFKEIILTYKLKLRETLFEKYAAYTRVRNIVVYEYATHVEESNLKILKSSYVSIFNILKLF
ncbi:MAG: hypothetical protein ACMXYB_01500 [Candidatus Woesearchaeota archaeon]